MKVGKSYGLLMVALGLLIAAAGLAWKGRDAAEAGKSGELDRGTSQIGGGSSNRAGTELLGTRRSTRGSYSGRDGSTLEEMVVIFQKAEKEKSEDEAELLRFAETIPLARWPRLIEELEKDNPPLGSSVCVRYWAKVDPEALLEFRQGGMFRFGTSKWRASMVLVEHFASKDSGFAIALFGEWDEEYGEYTDRDSWAQPMVESIASQERHSDEEKFEDWFRGLAEREQEWALEVAPEDSAIRKE